MTTMPKHKTSVLLAIMYPVPRTYTKNSTDISWMNELYTWQLLKAKQKKLFCYSNKRLYRELIL